MCADARSAACTSGGKHDSRKPVRSRVVRRGILEEFTETSSRRAGIKAASCGPPFVPDNTHTATYRPRCWCWFTKEDTRERRERTKSGGFRGGGGGGDSADRTEHLIRSTPAALGRRDAGSVFRHAVPASTDRREVMCCIDCSFTQSKQRHRTAPHLTSLRTAPSLHPALPLHPSLFLPALPPLLNPTSSIHRVACKHQMDAAYR